MNALEILFHPQGNTVFGDYSVAQSLYNAKPKMFPLGWTIICESKADCARLVENVRLWHNCLETVGAWRKVCELSFCHLIENPPGLNGNFLAGATVKQSIGGVS